jgi:putative transposase
VTDQAIALLAPRIGTRAACAAAAERRAILDVLHSARFADTPPAEAWATLLDEGIYPVAAFYRVLRAAGENRERRAQATHPATVKPELAAAGPRR